MFVRFTAHETQKGYKSFNGFTGEELKGVCCFQVTENELYLQIRKIADKNANYVELANCRFEIFYGNLIEKNFNNEGVVAEFCELIEEGFVKSTEFGYKVL